MLTRLLRGFALWLVVLPAWLPSPAQQHSYHTVNPDDVHFILVNDSKKTIEAFHAREHCGELFGWMIRDSLSLNILSKYEFGATESMQDRMVKPGGRFVSILSLINSRERCEEAVDAVIFSDGSYEGEEQALRGLQDERAGITESIKYWADRFRREKSDGSSAKSMFADSTCLAAVDLGGTSLR
jgi:hypothetical protein